jgi:predicted metallopeptidase
MISYQDAPDIRKKVENIINLLNFDHVSLERLHCIRSNGSASKNIIARCHALPKIMQKCLNMPASYIIEIISENFDNMKEEEQLKTLIHEILHIPKTFGGGFKHHNTISKRKVDSLFKKFKKRIKNLRVLPNDSLFSVEERKV